MEDVSDEGALVLTRSTVRPWEAVLGGSGGSEVRTSRLYKVKASDGSFLRTVP